MGCWSEVEPAAASDRTLRSPITEPGPTANQTVSPACNTTEKGSVLEKKKKHCFSKKTCLSLRSYHPRRKPLHRPLPAARPDVTAQMHPPAIRS